MAALRVGLCLLVVASADESSLLQWDKWDNQETNVKMLDNVLSSDARVTKIAALTHVSESQARARLSQAVSLLKTVKTEKDSAKLKTNSYSRTVAESLVRTPAMNKQIQDLKKMFQAEAPELASNSSSTAKVGSKTSRVADRMLREFEGKFFSKESPVDVAIRGANFGLTWGGRTDCTNMEGFALHFQYQRMHAMINDVFTFTNAEWHQRYGWIFEEGTEVWGQQNFPEGVAVQKSGLWLVMPYKAKTVGGPCVSKNMNFLVQFWIRIPAIVSQARVADSNYDISSTAEFLWTWEFDGTNSEPQASEIQVGAYVDLNGQDWFSFFFTEGSMLMQYLVTTKL